MNERPTHIDLFSGIGGFAIAAQWAGFQTVAFCEIESYAQGVLRERWPGVRIYSDVRQLDGRPFEGADLLTGGFPCQPFSLAGKRCGDSDERFLWPECVRLVREIRPRFALFENVPGLVTIDGGATINRVFSDLVALGYDLLWNCVPACAVGAPIERDRIWIVAVSNEGGREKGVGDFKHGPRPLLPWPNSQSEDVWIQTASRVCRISDGLSAESYKDRVGALGNAIVPQVAFEILSIIRLLL